MPYLKNYGDLQKELEKKKWKQYQEKKWSGNNGKKSKIKLKNQNLPLIWY